MKMKQSLVGIFGVILLLTGCGSPKPEGQVNEVSTAKAEQAEANHEKEDAKNTGEREHMTVNADSLLSGLTSYDSEGTPKYDMYWAYNAYGEVMFTVNESFDTLPFVSNLYFYDTEGKTSIESAALQEGNLLIVASEMDLEGRTYQKAQYLREGGLLQVNGGYEYTYADDGLSADIKAWDGSAGEVKYDENGNLIMETMTSAETGTSYSYERTFDEYGNMLTYDIHYDGSPDRSYTYEYELNEYGQPLTMWQVDSDGNRISKNLYKYDSLENVPEEWMNDPLVGYWRGELDGTEYFLCIAVNGMLCYGRLDENTKVPVAVLYAYYTIEDGSLDCEIYENYTEYSGSRNLEYEWDGDKLIFYEITWTKVE